MFAGVRLLGSKLVHYARSRSCSAVPRSPGLINLMPRNDSPTPHRISWPRSLHHHLVSGLLAGYVWVLGDYAALASQVHPLGDVGTVLMGVVGTHNGSYVLVTRRAFR